MSKAELLPFEDAEVLQHLPGRSVFPKAICLKALSIPSAEGGQGI